MPTFWIAQREDDTEGQLPRLRYIRRAVEAEAEKYAGETKSERMWGGVSDHTPLRKREPGEAKTFGHPFRLLRPLDEGHGLCLVEADSDEDVTGEQVPSP